MKDAVVHVRLMSCTPCIFWPLAGLARKSQCSQADHPALAIKLGLSPRAPVDARRCCGKEYTLFLLKSERACMGNYCGVMQSVCVDSETQSGKAFFGVAIMHCFSKTVRT